MDVLATGDRLEVLALAVGAVLVLGSLGSLAGLPWQTNPDVAAVGVSLFGILLTVGLGVALILVGRLD